MNSEDPAFTQLLQTLQRPINCIIDEVEHQVKQNRNTRLEGLNTVKRELQKNQQMLLKVVERTALAKNLRKALDDAIENNRKIALDILQSYLHLAKAQPDCDKDVLEAFLKTLIGRVNTTPFNEKSEQLRLIVVDRLRDYLPFSQLLASNISQLCNALSKCLADSFPELKQVQRFVTQSVCPLIGVFSRQLRYNIGHHSTSIVKELAINLSHQQFKVRRCAIETVGALLVTEGCGPNMQHVQAALKACMFDKKTEVRKATYQCISRLLNGFSIKNLKSYEDLLVGYLLNGLSDENADIASLTMDLLDDVGRKREQLDKQTNGTSTAMQAEPTQ